MQKLTICTSSNTPSNYYNIAKAMIMFEQQINDQNNYNNAVEMSSALHIYDEDAENLAYAA